MLRVYDQLLLQLLHHVDDVDGVKIAWLVPVDVEYLHVVLYHVLQIDGEVVRNVGWCSGKNEFAKDSAIVKWMDILFV